MGEIDYSALEFEDVRAILIRAGADPDVATMYAHAWVEYRSAQESITKNGAVVANPRTGAPIVNPYLKVRDSAEAKLIRLSCRTPGTPVLWK